MYFEPFLTIIQSEQTSGVVTHVALSAVNKFILYGFLTEESGQTMEVLCRTVLAVSNCRFESIDKTWDEQVYLQVCTVLLHCIICPGGVLLTDGGIWLCIKTCYEISRTESLSDIVCRHAEDVLMQMVLTVCSSIARKTIPEGGDRAIPNIDGADALVHLVDAAASVKRPDKGIGEVRTAYNSQVLFWIMNWLIELVDPRKPITLRAFGLNLINVALETSASVIGKVPAVVNVIGHDLCKFLLQNTQNGDDVTILSLSLRVIFNLFNSSLKVHLKVQLEVFFNTIHLRIPTLDDESCPYDKKELVRWHPLARLISQCPVPKNGALSPCGFCRCWRARWSSARSQSSWCARPALFPCTCCCPFCCGGVP